MCKYGLYSFKGHQVQNKAKKFGHAEPILLMILLDWYTLIQVKEQDRMERITVTLKELFLPL